MGSLFRRGLSFSPLGRKISEKTKIGLTQFSHEAKESVFAFPDLEFGLPPNSECKGLDLVLFGKNVLLMTHLGLGLVPTPLPDGIQELELWRYGSHQKLRALAAPTDNQVVVLNCDSRMRRLVLFDAAEDALWPLEGTFDEEHSAATFGVDLLSNGSDLGWTVNWNSSNKGYEIEKVSHLVSVKKKTVRECSEKALADFTPLEPSCTHLSNRSSRELRLSLNPDTGILEERAEKLALISLGEPRWSRGVFGPNAFLYAETFADDSARFAVWRRGRSALALATMHLGCVV